MSAAEVHVDCGGCVEHGLYDEVGTIDVRCADDLYISLGCAAVLAYQGCHILEDVGCKACLDDKHVVVALDRLHYAEVVDVAVVVQIEVGEHEGVIVEKVLELLYGIRLCKCCTYSLEVEVE